MLFVQVKKHRGVTDERAVRQVLQMMEQAKQQEGVDPDGCVMSLADDFNLEARRLASDNGIALLNGDAIAGLLIRQMVGRFDPTRTGGEP